jgi:hypothetical protein
MEGMKKRETIQTVLISRFFYQKVCRGRDLNPHDLTINGFSYHYGFRRLLSVCGLDDAFSVHRSDV